MLPQLLRGTGLLALALVNVGWASGGGAAQILFSLFGEVVFHRGAAGIGEVWGCAGIGLLIVSSYPNCQGFKIETTGPTDRKGIEVTGLWMVAEKWEETPDPPTQASDFSPENVS